MEAPLISLNYYNMGFQMRQCLHQPSSVATVINGVVVWRDGGLSPATSLGPGLSAGNQGARGVVGRMQNAKCNASVPQFHARRTPGDKAGFTLYQSVYWALV